MLIGLVFAFTAAIAYGVGTVAQSVGVHRLTGTTIVEKLSSGRLYIGGLVLDVLGFGASVVALRDLPLFFVESAVASSVGVTALVDFVVQGVRLSRASTNALLTMMSGLVLLAISAEPGAGREVSDAFGWVLLGCALALTATVVVGVQATGIRSAFVLAVSSGLGFGIVGIVARTVEIPHHWWNLAVSPLAWAFVIAGVVSVVACGYALDRAGATTVAALIFASETVAPALVGLVWLGDVVRPHMASAAAVGFVATLGACVALARMTRGGHGVDELGVASQA